MTITFEKLSKMSYSSFDKKIRHLNPEDTSSLQVEVKAWTPEQMEPAVRTLSRYYGTTVPDTLLKEILCENLDLAFEVYSESVSDTSPRGILMDAVLKKIGALPWPINGDSEKYKDEFYEKFRECGIAFGLKYSPKSSNKPN